MWSSEVKGQAQARRRRATLDGTESIETTLLSGDGIGASLFRSLNYVLGKVENATKW